MDTTYVSEIRKQFTFFYAGFVPKNTEFFQLVCALPKAIERPKTSDFFAYFFIMRTKFTTRNLA